MPKTWWLYQWCVSCGPNNEHHRGPRIPPGVWKVRTISTGRRIWIIQPSPGGSGSFGPGVWQPMGPGWEELNVVKYSSCVVRRCWLRNQRRQRTTACQGRRTEQECKHKDIEINTQTNINNIRSACRHKEPRHQRCCNLCMQIYKFKSKQKDTKQHRHFLFCYYAVVSEHIFTRHNIV